MWNGSWMQRDVEIVEKLGDVCVDFAPMRQRMVLNRNINDSNE